MNVFTKLFLFWFIKLDQWQFASALIKNWRQVHTYLRIRKRERNRREYLAMTKEVFLKFFLRDWTVGSTQIDNFCGFCKMFLLKSKLRTVRSISPAIAVARFADRGTKTDLSVSITAIFIMKLRKTLRKCDSLILVFCKKMKISLFSFASIRIFSLSRSKRAEKFSKSPKFIMTSEIFGIKCNTFSQVSPGVILMKNDEELYSIYGRRFIGLHETLARVLHFWKKLKKAVDVWYGCVSWQNNSFWHFTKQLVLVLYSLNHRNSTLRVNTLNVENSVSNYFLRKNFRINKKKRLWIQLEKLILLDYLSHNNLFHDNPRFKQVI